MAAYLHWQRFFNSDIAQLEIDDGDNESSNEGSGSESADDDDPTRVTKTFSHYSDFSIERRVLPPLTLGRGWAQGHITHFQYVSACGDHDCTGADGDDETCHTLLLL